MMKRLLNQVEKKRIENILRQKLMDQQEIVFAYLYGSFLLPVPCGDIDIAIYLKEFAVTPKHWEYETKLSMLLDHKVSMPVDILTLNCASLPLRYHATRGKLLFSKNEPARFAFLEATWSEYFDYKPYLQAFYKDLLS